MIREEFLLEWKKRLTADVIDDDEELVEWAIEYGPTLIDEVLMWRKWEQEHRKIIAENEQGI